jgi:outer membrane protein
MNQHLAAICALLLVPGVARSQEGTVGRRVLTLEQALRIARRNAPALRQAQAEARVAAALADQARAALLPRLDSTASYERTTANFVARPGFLPSTATTMFTPQPPSWNTFNYYSSGATLSYIVFDFGRTLNTWRSARESASAQRDEARAAALQLALDVRSAYLAAWAARAAVKVGLESVSNQQRHLEQIAALVKGELRPEVDLVTQEAQLASARVALINAENAYAVARAQLDQVMGVERTPGAPVSDVSDTLPPVAGENASLGDLQSRALAARPELAAARARVRATLAERRSRVAEYGPAITAYGSLTDAGSVIDDLTWNASAGVTLSWALFEGGLVPARVRESSAKADAWEAQRQSVRLAIRVELETALLSLRAAKAARASAIEARTAAAERLRQAEGRYTAGVGDIIELSDAQFAHTTAEVQVVQSEYRLGLARAQLLHALGEE